MNKRDNKKRMQNETKEKKLKEKRIITQMKKDRKHKKKHE